MRTKIIYRVALFVVLGSSFSSILAQEKYFRSGDLLQKMILQNHPMKTVKLDVLIIERVKTKMIEKDASFKIQYSPFKVFFKQSFLGLKVEALYNQGTNNNKMLLATQGFPWIQMNLDPLGEKARDNHHHTIFESGFTYFLDVISFWMEKHADEIDQLAIIKNTKSIKNGRQCYQLEISNNDFHYYKYKVLKGESLTSIANKLGVNDYMILEKNPTVKWFTDVKEGQQIIVPSDYGKQMTLFIDCETYLPIEIKVSDDKGIWGIYSYSNILINPVFAWNEFSATFPGYHFK